jgi:maltose alpha-D-glucosyltransferase/alpha-amylase
MVTDEERDYMYRMYAADPRMRINLGIRRRLAPLLGNNRRSMELLKGILFSLPGTPVLYYGDEIGMGDNIYLGDRNGVRTPMQWSADRNAGFSQANPHRLFLPVCIDPEYHYEAVNVETQQANPRSFLWWMKRMIAVNRRFKAFGRGSLEFLHPENNKILAFLRRYQEERILVVANLSRFTQCVELDLAPFAGQIPVEVFGGTEFPPVGDRPYFLSLGPHAFHWFTLEAPRPVQVQAPPAEAPLPVIELAGPWRDLFQHRLRSPLCAVLPGLLPRYRWFGGKARPIRSVELLETVPFPNGASEAVVALVQVHYASGGPETYAMPLAFQPGDGMAGSPGAIARLRIRDGDRTRDGFLYDALWVPALAATLLKSICRAGTTRTPASGRIAAWASRAFDAWPDASAPLEPSVLKSQQSNTSVVYGNRFILKFFRRLEDGVNPDYEVGRFLTERKGFPHVPPLAGALVYRRRGAEPRTLALLHGFVQSEGDAWRYTLDALGRFYERVLAQSAPPPDAALARAPLLDVADRDLPASAAEFIGPYLESARIIGERTAQLHLALAHEMEDPVFAPEPFTDFYRQGIYHAMVGVAVRSVQLLRHRLKSLPAAILPEARRVLELEGSVRRLFRPLRERKIHATRIRIHGDYHLGQLLFTGKDFVFLDFEGEPDRPLSERRIKRSPLRDVAGMVRSFHYASVAALVGLVAGVRPEDASRIEAWSRWWYACTSAAFLRAYRAAAGPAAFLPADREELRVLLDAYLLEKAVFELGYELNNRPDWVRIPLQGILFQIEAQTTK